MTDPNALLREVLPALEAQRDVLLQMIGLSMASSEEVRKHIPAAQREVGALRNLIERISAHLASLEPSRRVNS